MLLLHLHHSLSLHKHPLFSPSPLFFNNHKSSVSAFGLERWETLKKSSRRRRRGQGLNSFYPLKAVDNKDSDYEVDPDKAREALRNLDEQLQSLAQKKPNPPKIKDSDMNRAPSRMTEVPEQKEISASDLINLAIVLFLFTIFYNVLFLALIKPAIDGPDTAPDINSLLEIQKPVPFQRT